jgi:hypothetical protein
MMHREVTEEKQILLFSLLIQECIQACNILYMLLVTNQIIIPQQHKKRKL